MPHGFVDMQEPKSLTERVYDLLLTGEVGTLFDYEQLRAVGCDVRQPGQRSTIYAAARRILKDRGLAVVNRRGEGYEIAHPDSTPSLIGRRTVKADRQLREGGALGQHVTRSGMSPEKQKETDAWTVCVLAMRREIRDAKRRLNFHSGVLARHEQAIEELKEGQQAQLSEDEVHLLRQMLREKGEPVTTG